MNNKYFDQILGSQVSSTSSEEKIITKNILDALIKEQPNELTFDNQRVGVKLQMNTYLNDKSDNVIGTGEFLNRLFLIYNIKKSKFAQLIGMENANLHALLKGRRKFNSKLAFTIGEIFKIKPELWMFIEAKNELKKYNSKKRVKLKNLNIMELSHDR